MGVEFLEAIAKFTAGLNALTKSVTGESALTPYLGRIPVWLDGCLCGFLEDVAEDYWMYQPATTDEVAKWEKTS